MKIKELNENVFYDFVSRQINANVKFFKEDLKLKRTDSEVKIKFYVGGESADERRFVFTDDTCMYYNAAFNQVTDKSREWVTYLADEVCETEEYANYFIDKYNEKIERRISDYSKEQASLKIV